MPSEKSPISYLIIISKFFKAQPDLTALEKKWNMPGFSGKFALDDYGSGMMIIAEGLETPVELEKVLELEVDLLQGYFLAKPFAIPMPASEASVLVIESYWKQHK